MKIGIRQKLLLLSFFVFTINGFLGYAVYKSRQRFLTSEQWIHHTENVIYQADLILSLGKDMANASRGFVITNDSTYLESFYTAQKTFHPYIEELSHLTQDNPSHKQSIDSLNLYMLKLLDFSLQTIELRNKEGLASAIAYVSNRHGKNYLDQVRDITNDIQQRESILLKQRNQISDQSITTSNGVLVSSFIVLMTLTLILIYVARKYLVQTKEKEKRGKELILANKELAFQNKEKGKRAEELVLANNELESFSYSVSHDLRAPLRAIHGYARMLKEDYENQLDTEANRLMNNIMLNAKKMGQLIDDLLTFSRLGRKELLKRNIPMQDMVTEICREMKMEHSDRNIQFKVNTLEPVLGDSAALNQVWTNLISNAVKYSKLNEVTIIEIGSEVRGDEIIYSIKDNGAGFDMRYASKLFGVFQRLHSDEKFEGTGVGLAIVHRIISKHKGRVWAEGKVNEGATFNFSLPISLIMK